MNKFEKQTMKIMSSFKCYFFYQNNYVFFPEDITKQFECLIWENQEKFNKMHYSWPQFQFT